MWCRPALARINSFSEATHDCATLSCRECARTLPVHALNGRILVWPGFLSERPQLLLVNDANEHDNSDEAYILISPTLAEIMDRMVDHALSLAL